MSELKSFDIVVAEEGYGEGIVKYRRAVYDKSEADRYIAELQSANQLEIDEWYNKLMHQKYKRCLAMAKWCEIGAQFQHNNAMQFDNPFYIKRAEWLEKWKKRWLELAEKFKEAE